MTANEIPLTTVIRHSPEIIKNLLPRLIRQCLITRVWALPFSNNLPFEEVYLRPQLRKRLCIFCFHLDSHHSRFRPLTGSLLEGVDSSESTSQLSLESSVLFHLDWVIFLLLLWFYGHFMQCPTHFKCSLLVRLNDSLQLTPADLVEHCHWQCCWWQPQTQLSWWQLMMGWVISL